MVKFKDIYLTNGKSYSADIRLLDAVWSSNDGRKKEIDISRIFFELSRKKLELTNYETDYKVISRHVQCLLVHEFRGCGYDDAQ